MLLVHVIALNFLQFYVDPDTGYAFCSLKDALRYLATGNILSCVMRPRKRSTEEVQALMSSSKVCKRFY
jgi:pyruvoyl-dependent arginine decarboxylase (PvlArgDC)